jgi:uncharacterized protein (DUF1800 family)
MLRRLCIAALVFAFSAAPALAIPPRTFAISELTAAAPSAAPRDAGIDVSTSRFVRVSASGVLTTRYGACGHYFTPGGCSGAQGMLMAAFANSSGRPVSNWLQVGTYATLSVPFGAQRLLLRVNGVSGHEVGTYRVVADGVPSAIVATLGTASSAAPASTTQSNNLQLSTTRLGGTSDLASSSYGSSGSANTTRSFTRVSLASGRAPGSGPYLPSGTTQTRSDLQYVMRRLGFSDSPEQVTYWYQHGGISAWLANQLNYTAISDSTLPVFVYAMPTLTGNTSQFPDDAYNEIVENRLMQQEVASQRQLLEKLTLRWLELFSVSNYVVNSPGAMDHYIETVRADALGNFAKLVSDVSKEPAMLYWLDNNYNNGNNPSNPPNQNYGREIMQLYTIGLTQLNMDGTPVLDGSGNPVPTYAQSDVVTASEAMTGFQVIPPSTLTGAWPSYLEQVRFSPAYHYNPANNGGNPLPQIFGKTITDPGGTQCAWVGTAAPGSAASGPCVVDNLVSIITSQPTTCAFQAKQMIQYLANENPSPGYVSRVATVWCNNLTASNQIALVVNAVATDPEFMAGKYTMVKEPIEFEVDAIRALRGPDNPVSANPITGNNVPLNGPVNDSGISSNTPGNMEQRAWYPPTVFSFYYPGQRESLVNNIELLYRWTTSAHLGSDVYDKQPTNQQDTSLDLTAFVPAGSNATSAEINKAVNYMLDALVDGGTPELKELVTNYMMNFRASTSGNNQFQNGLRGALWMILSSPEYEAN